jgi:hypothetical protein
MSGYALEPAGNQFAEFRKAVAGMEAWAAGPEAAGLDLAALEREAEVRGREAQRLLLQAHLDARTAREERLAGVTGPDGAARTRAERGHGRNLATVLGKVRVRRIAYRSGRRGVPNVHLLDEQLSLPPGKFSAGLCERLALAAGQMSIKAACGQVFRETGVRIGTRQASRIIRAAAADAASFARGQSGPAPDAGDRPVLVLEADGKGIKMRPDSLRPAAARAAAAAVPRQAGRLSQGEVSTHKRMAEAGAVFDWEPVPRTAADIVPLPGEEHPAQVPAGLPEAGNKYLTASVASSTGEVIAAVFGAASRRDPGRERTWIGLVDGNKDQLAHFRAQAAARGVAGLPVLIDFIHVTGYLRDAAWSFFPKDSPAAGSWVRRHERAILDGHAGTVAAAISDQARTTPGLSASKHKNALRTVRYLETKLPFMDYPRFLAAGWPISTGVIEGACRYLIKDRMDITGARWSTDGAEAILQLRVITANGHWDAYWAWHQQQQHRRTYHNHRNCYQLAA